MDIEILKILDRAVQGGGENLSKSVAGKGAKADSALTTLLANGYFEKSKTKYTLTEKGRQAWEAGRATFRTEAMAGFLALVKMKGKLTKTDLKQYPEDLPREALEKKLVVAGDKENTFQLLPAGEAALLAGEPLDKQVASLRALREQADTFWEAGLKRVEKELSGLGEDEARPDILASLRDRVAQARSGYESAIEELRAFGILAEAARRLQAQTTQATHNVLREVQVSEEQVRRLAAELRAEADTFRQHFDSRFAALEQRLGQIASERASPEQGTQSEAAMEKSSPPALPEERVFEETASAHDEIHKANQRLGGIVKVPELYDAVRRHTPGLSLAEFHALLVKWRDEDRLVLQVCNNPDAEPRAKEGIETSKGLLFYVQRT